jgi:hypothetical protein
MTYNITRFNKILDEGINMYIIILLLLMLMGCATQPNHKPIIPQGKIETTSEHGDNYVNSANKNITNYYINSADTVIKKDTLYKTKTIIKKDTVLQQSNLQSIKINNVDVVQNLTRAFTTITVSSSNSSVTGIHDTTFLKDKHFSLIHTADYISVMSNYETDTNLSKDIIAIKYALNDNIKYSDISTAFTKNTDAQTFFKFDKKTFNIVANLISATTNIKFKIIFAKFEINITFDLDSYRYLNHLVK